jgi:hypothetical protein
VIRIDFGISLKRRKPKVKTGRPSADSFTNGIRTFEWMREMARYDAWYA